MNTAQMVGYAKPSPTLRESRRFQIADCLFDYLDLLLQVVDQLLLLVDDFFRSFRHEVGVGQLLPRPFELFLLLDQLFFQSFHFRGRVNQPEQ